DTLLVVAAPAPIGGQAGIVPVTVLVNGKTSNALSFTYTAPVSAAHYTVSTVAGNGTQGYLDGPALSAEFDLAFYPAADLSGNIYVSDQSDDNIRKISPAGVVSTLAGTGVPGFKDGPGDSAQFYNPRGIATDAQGNIYLADFSNNRIRKITPAGVVSTFAGGVFGYSDGPALSARFLEPAGITQDAQGNFFVADTYNNRIREISASGTVSTVAGDGNPGLKDGPGATAQLQYPYAVAVDGQGNIYVADTYNNVVRKITSAGVVSTLAGNGQAGFADGPGASAQFNTVTGITIDSKANLYVVDNGNARIRMITPAGVVSTIAGNGAGGHVDGPGPSAEFSNPYGICTDAQGNLYVGENAYVRKITIQ
ncbi:MAG TPA: NHL repeat-containing protein, partial [Bryobacteraceae bacterium]